MPLKLFTSHEQLISDLDSLSKSNLPEFARAFFHGNYGYGYSPQSWYGGNLAQRFFKLREGNQSGVSQVEEYLTQVEYDIEIPVMTWKNSVAGVLPDVPAFISGFPESMIRKEHELHQRSPIRIFVNLTSSAGVNEKQYYDRGLLITAATQLLMRLRPVELYVFHSTKCYSEDHISICAYQVDMDYFDTSRMLVVMADQCFARGMLYAYSAARLQATDFFPYDSGEDQLVDPNSYVSKQIAKRLGADNDNSMVIPPIHLYDPMLSKPKEWLDSVIKRFTTEEDYAG